MKLFLHIAILASLAETCFGAAAQQPTSRLLEIAYKVETEIATATQNQSSSHFTIDPEWTRTQNFENTLSSAEKIFYTNAKFYKMTESIPAAPSTDQRANLLDSIEPVAYSTYSYRLTATAAICCLWGWQLYQYFKKNTANEDAKEQTPPISWIKRHKKEIALAIASAGAFGIGTFLDYREAGKNIATLKNRWLL
ncbi:MAG: hypothetical protein WCT20_02810 [Candidatus Babeliales bacterium]